LKGLSGVLSDYRAVEEAAGNGNRRAQTALNVYHYRVKKYIGAYAAAMGGIDVLVFTGGVGGNSFGARREICDNMEFLGIRLSAELNEKANGSEILIHEKGFNVKVAIIPANEELVIAREVVELANWKSNNKSSKRFVVYSGFAFLFLIAKFFNYG